jgi:WD40 repeat protein
MHALLLLFFVTSAQISPPAEILHRFEGSVLDVQFSPSGKYLAAFGRGGEVNIWNMAERKAIRTSKILFRYSLLFSPDERLLVIGGLDEIYWWEFQKEEHPTVQSASVARAGALAFARAGKLLVTGDWKGLIVVWDVGTKKAQRVIRAHKGIITSIVIAQDGKTVFSSGQDGTLKVWRLDDEQWSKELHGHSRPLTSLSVSPDSKHLAGACFDGSIRVWDWRTGATVRELKGHADLVSCVRYTTDGKFLISGSHDKTVRLWDAETGKPLRSFTGHTQGVVAVAVHPNGKLIASGGFDSELRLWRIEWEGEVLNKKGRRPSIVDR